ncbi:hypothetical protein [Nostoc sp.]
MRWREYSNLPLKTNDQAHQTQTTSATQLTILGHFGAETFLGAVIT